MLQSSCIFLALACISKASVIVNVFEDGEVKASHSLQDCNPQECNKFCRKAGFNEGTCVNNKCRCTSYADFTENKAAFSLHGSCNYQACDQLCRRLGFPGGACVGDKCKCDNFEPIGIREDKNDFSVYSSCNNQACDQLCRRLGFPGGACIGDKCKCDNFEPVEIKGKALEYLLRSYKGQRTFNSLETCYLPQCEEICLRYGYLYAYCDGENCVCGGKGNNYFYEVSNDIKRSENKDEQDKINVMSSKERCNQKTQAIRRGYKAIFNML